MPEILAPQEADSRFKASLGKMKIRPYLENTQHE
jgi:hypothetical protein